MKVIGMNEETLDVESIYLNGAIKEIVADLQVQESARLFHRLRAIHDKRRLINYYLLDVDLEEWRQKLKMDLDEEAFLWLVVVKGEKGTEFAGGLILYKTTDGLVYSAEAIRISDMHLL